MWLPWLLRDYLATTKQFGVTLQWRVQKAVDCQSYIHLEMLIKLPKPIRHAVDKFAIQNQQHV